MEKRQKKVRPITRSSDGERQPNRELRIAMATSRRGIVFFFFLQLALLKGKPKLPLPTLLLLSPLFLLKKYSSPH
jgi:hypothetical protein